jgi:hypothetical protein
VVATWEELRKACAPAFADLERSRPGLLRLGPAPAGIPSVDPWGHAVSKLWLCDADGGSGTGVWLGDPDEDLSWAFGRATEVIQEAAIEAVHGAWPECPHHPGTHPLEIDEVDGHVVWVCTAAEHRVVAKVGELPVQPTAAS